MAIAGTEWCMHGRSYSARVILIASRTSVRRLPVAAAGHDTWHCRTDAANASDHTAGQSDPLV